MCLLCRRERKVNDVAYKMKRGGFPGNVDTPPLVCSDSSDDQQDGTPVPGSATPWGEKGADSAVTPHACGRRKRRRRKQSNSKDEKGRDSAFLDKVQSSDLLARRQSLPPLLTLQVAHDLERNPSTSTLLDETGPQDRLSRDSTPRPKHPDTPITPNGSFSPEVSELIESVRYPLKHRRNGSNGSARMMHRRQGSNGSAASFKGHSHEATPIRGTNPSTATSSKRNSAELLTQLNLSSSRRESGSGIPYSKMDVSDSNFCAEQPNESTTNNGAQVPFPSQDGAAPPHHPKGHVKDVCSNESSMDTHESGNEADAESTSDCYEKFGGLSGTEPNETTAESNFESSAASPSQAESDELTSDIMESSMAANLIPMTRSKAPLPPLAYLGHDLSHDKFSGKTTLGLGTNSLTTPTSATPTSPMPILATPTVEYHGNHQVATLVSQFEQNLLTEDSEAASETSLTGLVSIPVHIRRQQSQDRQDDETTNLTTPTSGRLGSMTAIVRTFFENMSSKQKRAALHNQDSGEFEDSGFQVSG